MPIEKINSIKNVYPKGGLSPGESWLISPKPFVISNDQFKYINGLGKVLTRFIRTCQTIYLRSVKGTLPDYIHKTLETSKPQWLIDIGRESARKGEFPKIIRPDLILTEEGFSLTEIDNLPGGIGLTAWLNQVYENLGYKNIVGEGNLMVKNFSTMYQKNKPVDIVISKESSDYKAEMKWLCDELNKLKIQEWNVKKAESYSPQLHSMYRFYELFDYKNVPVQKIHQEFTNAKETNGIELTSPYAHYLEEKNWMAFFWTQHLQSFWQREMRYNYAKVMEKLIPYTWLLNPATLPYNAAIPKLDVNSWNDVANYSNKQRRLVLKASGFSDISWGSKSITIGHDVSKNLWANKLNSALESYHTSPFLMQKFKKAKLIYHNFYNEKTKSIEIMKGRVRLCPYYFWDNLSNSIKLSGILATICPEDKKIIHGMKDSILVPCSVQG